MAVKLIEVAEIGTVRLHRKRGIKNINLRIDTDGIVRVSQPWMVPQSMVLAFVRSKAKWIKNNQVKITHEWSSGQKVTPELKLLLLKSGSSRPSKKILENKLTISIPAEYASETAKAYIQKSIIAEQKSFTEKEYLPNLANIAKENGFSYSSARVKALKSRWGSCDHQKNIILNAYLACLPYDIAEYILVHELAHTKHLNHSQKFWQTIEQILPNFKEARKELREYQPAPRPYSVS